MAIYLAQVKTLNELLPSRGPSTYSAGIQDKDKGYAKYGPKSSTNPNLLIVNPIYDDDRNVIMPGFYELILSADRTMLILEQSGQVVATFPVFKIEEDKSQEQVSQPMDNKSQKKFDKNQKKQVKKNKKLVKQGKIPDGEPEIYTNATVQYDDKGDYYLIKYERGKIRAWGAIK
ncbi:MAG: hypothetical protein WCY19_06315 [Candidatus Gastranaerophilaceae bacterium]